MNQNNPSMKLEGESGKNVEEQLRNYPYFTKHANLTLILSATCQLLPIDLCRLESSYWVACGSPVLKCLQVPRNPYFITQEVL